MLEDDVAATGLRGLGRRVRSRRTALGLSRQDLADAASMDPAYLAYVEEAPAEPSSRVLRRLALALGTSVAALLGEERAAAPGAAEGEGSHALQEVGEGECWQLVGSRGVGGVALEEAGDEAGRVLVHPVDYAVVHRTLLVRTDVDSALADAAARGAPVSLEVDEVDQGTGEGWSVLVQGSARWLGPEEARRLRQAITSRVTTDRAVLVAITPQRTTGRRIVAR